MKTAEDDLGGNQGWGFDATSQQVFNHDKAWSAESTMEMDNTRATMKLSRSRDEVGNTIRKLKREITLANHVLATFPVLTIIGGGLGSSTTTVYWYVPTASMVKFHENIVSF